MINYSLRPWEICCIVFVLIWLFSSLAVIKWINYEKKINQHFGDSNHGYRIGPSNGNKTKEEEELYNLWLQIPPDQQKKHADGL